jgi:hypothetical protein
MLGNTRIPPLRVSVALHQFLQSKFGPSSPQTLVISPAKRGSEAVRCQLSSGGLASVRMMDSVALGLSGFSQKFIPPLLQTRLRSDDDAPT